MVVILYSIRDNTCSKIVERDTGTIQWHTMGQGYWYSTMVYNGTGTLVCQL